MVDQATLNFRGPAPIALDRLRICWSLPDDQLHPEPQWPRHLPPAGNACPVSSPNQAVAGAEQTPPRTMTDAFLWLILETIAGGNCIFKVQFR